MPIFITPTHEFPGWLYTCIISCYRTEFVNRMHMAATWSLAAPLKSERPFKIAVFINLDRNTPAKLFFF